MKIFFAILLFFAMCFMASNGINVLAEALKLIVYFIGIFLIYGSLVWIWFGNPFKQRTSKGK